jgi:1-deoxy-D-xylulose-5-phosphate synthase
MEKLLENITDSSQLKSLSMEQLESLAKEIRKEIIITVANNGGHLASNLGIVEVAIALHRVFNFPVDKLIWDVGHQSYPHKLLTGRYKQFRTLRQLNGISGFSNPSESPYDAFITGHASTSISAALGMAIQRDLKRRDEKIIAVIGDGGLTCGMALEGMNNLGYLGTDMIVVLNDNEKSISASVGALSVHLSRLRLEIAYRKTKQFMRSLFHSPSLAGRPSDNILSQIRHRIKQILTPSRTGAVFQELGFIYLGPIDGHNMELLIDTFKSAKGLRGPILIHVITKKGKGYKFAENDSTKFHGISPFNSTNGKAEKKVNKISYTKVFGKTLIDLAKENGEIVAVTAAMSDGAGLNRFASLFPERFFDVGIAEEHAVTFAAGLAKAGAKPVAAIYSTFLQRAYDQIAHDVCLQNLPVTLVLDRGGIVGEDGPTHHGVFDFAYLRHLPNMVVAAPKDENELRHMLKTAIDYDGPMAIRYPKAEVEGVTLDHRLENIPIGTFEILREGNDLTICTVGSMVAPSLRAAEILAKEGVDSTVINCRFIKPLDEKLILQLIEKTELIITVEEHVLSGGFGSALVEFLVDKGCLSTKVLRLGIPDAFVEHGPRNILLEKYDLTPEGIVKRAKGFMNAEGKYLQENKELSEIEQRKNEHLLICMQKDVQFKKKTTGFEKYHFMYQSLPEINFQDIDLTCQVLGKELSAPFLICPMTGGTGLGRRINKNLARAAQTLNISMGVGSQRAAIENPSLEYTYQVRDVAPDILLFGNLGAVQLNSEFGLPECTHAVNMIDADAIFLHLNPLHECLQEAGDGNFENLLFKIDEICRHSTFPVLLRETGGGISQAVASQIRKIPLSGIDVSGTGGTSWGRIEAYRKHTNINHSFAETLCEWGIPTAESLKIVKEEMNGTLIIASGGIRNGVDMAKALALGADVVGVALPLLKPAAQSHMAVIEIIEKFLKELKITMLCIGAKNLSELKASDKLKKYPNDYRKDI